VQCNLVIDEMSIRKQVEMDNNRNIYGFVDLVTSNDASDPDKINANNKLFSECLISVVRCAPKIAFSLSLIMVDTTH